MRRSTRPLLQSLCAILLATGAARGAESLPGPWDAAPPLPKPTGRVVNVANVKELQAAVAGMQSGDTVLIAPGTYVLPTTLGIDGGKAGPKTKVTLRGATGRRDDVVIRGAGMGNKAVTHGIYVGNAQDVLIADLSIGDVFNHPIMLNGPAGVTRVHVYNCRLFDAGEQFVKVSPSKPDGSGTGVDDCSVRYCVIEYTDRSRSWYTEGIDVHCGSGWVVSDNLFRNIRGPKSETQNTGGAIDFWNRSKDMVVERNTIINCEVGIRIGILDRKGYDDAAGGIVRNNFVWRAKDACFRPDVGIAVNDAAGTQVLHNTVILEDGYPNGFESRFPAAKGILFANNLTNKAIAKRDRSEAREEGNVTKAGLDWFVNPTRGDLHLAAKAAGLPKVRTLGDAAEDFDGGKRPAAGTDPGGDDRSVGRPAGGPTVTRTPGTAP